MSQNNNTALIILNEHTKNDTAIDVVFVDESTDNERDDADIRISPRSIKTCSVSDKLQQQCDDIAMTLSAIMHPVNHVLQVTFWHDRKPVVLIKKPESAILRDILSKPMGTARAVEHDDCLIMWDD